MKNLLNKYNKYFISFCILLLLLIFISLIYLCFNINYSIIAFIVIILNLLLSFILSYIYVKDKNQKGILLGLRFGLIYSFVLFIMSIFFKCFKISSLLYYIIIILISIFGAIISKNKK